MKTVFLILASMFMLVSMSCKKKSHTLEAMTVVKDCTGTYLRLNGKDYQVCNLEKTNPYVDGASVKAYFTKISECKDLREEIVCFMYHENEGWIEVINIQ